MTRRDEVVEERLAEALGRPVKRCLNCGRVNAAHWVADHLDDQGLFVPGTYTCEAAQ